MKDPLAQIIKDNAVKTKRYNLSIKAELYNEIMALAKELGDDAGRRVSAAKVVEGCVALYKQQRAHNAK